MTTGTEEITTATVSAQVGAGSGIYVPSLADILAANPDEFIAAFTDIAAVNLACAVGLPKSEDIDFPKYLTLLDTMAAAVRRQTEKSWRLFKIKPAEFDHSENVFRVLTMEHVLRVQFNIKYNSHVWEKTKNREDWNTADSSEIFIHGILNENNRTGTCSSLPVVSVAVGRRLGYPLQWMRVPNHTLFRWDDGKEVFNVQHTFSGSELKTDEYFHDWPLKWDTAMFAMNERTKVWLRSMTPRQEVSKALCNRALILREVRRFDEAFEALDAAERFDPKNPAPTDLRFDIQARMGGGIAFTPMVSMQFNDAHFGAVSTSAAIEPGRDQLLNTVGLFRDRTKDPKNLSVLIRRIVDEQQPPPPVVVTIPLRPERKERGR